MAEVIRALLGLLLVLCCTTAQAQNLIYPAYPQPPAPAFYGGGYSPYGYGGFGVGGYGLGGYGFTPYGFGANGFGIGGIGYGGFGYGGLGYGGYGFGARGYYPMNTLGNMNLLPPNRPSPYYVTPSPGQYLDQAQRREEATYADILLRHSAQQ